MIGRMQVRDVQEPAVLQINGPDGDLLVRLDMDGSVEFGDGYQPQEAARLFWRVLAECLPTTRCRSCGAVATLPGMSVVSRPVGRLVFVPVPIEQDEEG